MKSFSDFAIANDDFMTYSTQSLHEIITDATTVNNNITQEDNEQGEDEELETICRIIAEL